MKYVRLRNAIIHRVSYIELNGIKLYSIVSHMTDHDVYIYIYTYLLCEIHHLLCEKTHLSAFSFLPRLICKSRRLAKDEASSFQSTNEGND